MVSLLDVKRTNGDGEIVFELLADSKEDTLPIKLEDIPGMSGTNNIQAGSICITPALDMCIMRNDGTWGPWV